MSTKIVMEDMVNIDFKYICGRDNYNCTNCRANVNYGSAFIKKIDSSGEQRSSNLTTSCLDCLNKNTFKVPQTSFSGRLIVITGPMYSAKSTTTQSLYKKYTTFNKNSVWVKPELDDRKKEYTKTHNDDEIPAFTIDTQRPDLSLDELLKYEIIAIDEVQFFNERIIYVIHKLLEKGSLVIVNGLKLTALRNTFGVMPYLLSEADDIICLKAICNVCGCVDYATRTKCFNLNTPSVSTGGAEKYYAACPACDGSQNEFEFLKKSVQEKTS